MAKTLQVLPALIQVRIHKPVPEVYTAHHLKKSQITN